MFGVDPVSLELEEDDGMNGVGVFLPIDNSYSIFLGYKVPSILALMRRSLIEHGGLSQVCSLTYGCTF